MVENPDYRGMAAKSVQVRRLKHLERRIRELVDAAPPLTDEQRRQLAVLLQPQKTA